VGMLLRETLVMVTLGTLLGVATASLLARFIEKMLFGVTPLDPLTTATVAVTLALAAIAATLAPALRAARGSIAETLRAG